MNERNERRNKNKNTKNRNKKEKEEVDASVALPPKTRKSASTLLDALSKWSVAVKKNGWMAPFIRDLGIPCFESEKWCDPPVKGHGLTHACRSAALVCCFGDAIQHCPDTKDLVTLDVFGRPALFLPNVLEGVKIYTTSLRDPEFTRFPGDSARSGSALTEMLPRTADIATWVDIYNGSGFHGDLAPADVSKVLTATNWKKGYIILHPLEEIYGADIFEATVSDGESVKRVSRQEGSWITVKSGASSLVSFMPESGTVPYPAHPVPRWMFTRSIWTPSGYLDVHQFKSLGPFSVFKVSLCDGPPLSTVNSYISNLDGTRRYVTLQSLDVVEDIKQRFSACWEEAFSIYRGANSTESTKIYSFGYREYLGLVPVDIVVADEMVNQKMFLDNNARVLRSFMSSIEASIRRSPVGLLAPRHPRLSAIVASNTLLYVLTSRREQDFVERASEEHDAPSRTQIESHRWNASQPFTQGTGAPAASWFSYMKPLAIGITGGYLLWKWWNRSTPSPVAYIGGVAEYPINPLGLSWLDPKCDMWSHWDSVPEALMAGESAPASVFLTKAWALFCSPAVLIGSAMEEVVKFVFGPIATAALCVFETTPFLLEGAKDPLWSRIAPNLFHISTSYLLTRYGVPALVPCILAHWGFNLLTVATYHWLVCGNDGFAHLVEALTVEQAKEVVRSWASATETSIKGWFPLGLGTRVRSFPASTACFRPETADWRIALSSISIGAAVHRLSELSAEQALHLEGPTHSGLCSCNHLPGAFGTCNSCRLVSVEAPAQLSYPLVHLSGSLYPVTPGLLSNLSSVVKRAFRDNLNRYGSPKVELFYRKQLEAQMSVTVKPWVDELHSLLIQKRNDFSPEEIAASLSGPKAMIFRHEHDQWTRFGISQVGKKAGAKTNETIKPTENGHEVELAPRMVIFVSPKIYASSVEFGRVLDRELRELLDGSQVFEVGGFKWRPHIAKVQYESLLDIGTLLATSLEIYSVVSCDDNVTFFGTYGDLFGAGYMMADHSAYDQSQSKPMFDLSYPLAETLGASLEWLDMQDLLSSSPSTVHLKRGKKTVATLTLALRYMMATGSVITSIFGSVHNLFTLCNFLVRKSQDRGISYTAACAEMGIETKVAYSDTLNGVDFLKGVFIEAGNVVTWNVFPSTILKITKAFRNPSTITGLAGEAGYVQLAHAIAQSVDVPDDYPVLGQYKAALGRMIQAHRPLRLPVVFDPNLVEQVNQYKLRYARAPRHLILKWMCERYSVQPLEILELESLLSSISSLPILIAHPLLDKMRLVDYA